MLGGGGVAHLHNPEQEEREKQTDLHVVVLHSKTVQRDPGSSSSSSSAGSRLNNSLHFIFRCESTAERSVRLKRKKKDPAGFKVNIQVFTLKMKV